MLYEAQITKIDPTAGRIMWEGKNKKTAPTSDELNKKIEQLKKV